MQHIEAVFAHTMDVVALLRETAFIECARFVFQELFETVACQLFVFDVIGFMFFCDKWTRIGFCIAWVNERRVTQRQRVRIPYDSPAYLPISALFLNV